MVLDEPAHHALSVMTLIALAGQRGPLTAPEIVAELEVPASGINRALRDLTAARLLMVDLEPNRIGYTMTRAPSTVTIAEIVEAARGANRRAGGQRPQAQPARFQRNTSERLRLSLMAILARITLSDVLYARVAPPRS